MSEASEKVRRVQLGKCLKYNKSISAELEKISKKTTRVERYLKINISRHFLLMIIIIIPIQC